LVSEIRTRAGERSRADLWRRRGERFLDLADRANAEAEAP
jgi:hypothetical protein